MLEKHYKCGLYLGRFQPLHDGHVRVVTRMLADCDSIIIAIGSAQESGTVKNPLTYDFRKQLIEETFPYHIDRITIVPVVDRETYSDDPSWGDYLLQQIYSQCDLRPTVIYEGHENTRTNWYDNIDISVVKIPREYMPISGTEIRNDIKVDNRYYVVAHTPYPIYEHYDKIREEILNACNNKRLD